MVDVYLTNYHYLLSPLPTFFRVETKKTGYSMLIPKNLVIFKKPGYS